MSIARRPVMLSALALLGVGMAAGIAVEASRLLRKRIRSPYEDITDQIADQKRAIELGRAVIAKLGHFDSARAANRLRIRKGTLAELAREDLKRSRLLEARGWVLPESLALASAILADQAGRTG